MTKNLIYARKIVRLDGRRIKYCGLASGNIP